MIGNRPTTAFPAENGYVLICSRQIDGQEASGWLSPNTADAVWDEFLENVPVGHFQQSSFWSRAKKLEGWQTIRIVIKWKGEIVGGFQILHQRISLGRIGYIFKGPVIASANAGVVDFILEAVKLVTKANRLKALIFQAPDLDAVVESIIARHGFLPNRLKPTVMATLLLDLAEGMDAIGRAMRKNTWVEIRQAERRGIKVRVGGEEDIGTFFHLMLATCERQKTRPIPATEAELLEVWKVFYSASKIKLFLAEYEGEAVAGTLCLCFGRRVAIWKKGWSGQHRERHPSQLVLFESIRWVASQGYEFFDFCRLERELAEHLSRGEPLTDSQKRGRDFVHLGYGGRPVLFPPSYVYASNPLFRWGYKCVIAHPKILAFAYQMRNFRSAIIRICRK